MSPNDPAMLQRRRKGHLSAEEKAEGAAAASTTTATTPQKPEDLAQDSRFDPSQMALITQEMVHVPDAKQGRTEVPAECSGEEMLALQDFQRPNGSEAQVKEEGDTWEGGPRGLPVALMPPGIQGSPEPLFTPEQAKQLEESQMQASFIYQDRWGSSPDGATWMSMATPPGMETSHHPHLDRRVQQVEEERLFFQWKMEKEKMAMAEAMKRMHDENVRLKLQLLEEKEKFATPEEATPDKKVEDRKAQALRRLQNQAGILSKEDGPECRQVQRTKEDGPRGRQVLRSKEDGPEGRQVRRSQEDGPECRQAQRSKEDGPRGRQVSGSKEDRPRGQQYLQEDGQGCRQDLQEDGLGGRQDLQEDGPGGRQDLQEDGRECRQDEGGSDDPPDGEDSEGSDESSNGGGHGHRRKKNQGDEAFTIMLKLMKGMQSMQKELMKKGGSRRSRSEDAREDEYIRGGVELHRLLEWSSESAPVDFQDWLMLIDPQMSDLTASSSEWWIKVVNAARSWYQKHQTLKPIEKLQHEVKAPSEIQKAKWNRLVPEAQKEDIIASKSLSVLGILTRLMVNYQPGGAQEKAAVLVALEMPQEANSVGEAISGLRRWLRWKRRALDINVMLPDPSVMLRGLDRLVGKVLGSQPTLQFRSI